MIRARKPIFVVCDECRTPILAYIRFTKFGDSVKKQMVDCPKCGAVYKIVGDHQVRVRESKKNEHLEVKDE